MKNKEPLHSEKRPVLSIDEMKAMKESLSKFSKFIISVFITKMDSKKISLFMYSLARAIVQIDSIFLLYETSM